MVFCSPQKIAGKAAKHHVRSPEDAGRYSYTDTGRYNDTIRRNIEE